ncbi:HAD family hydrolase [Escherichia coli]
MGIKTVMITGDNRRPPPPLLRKRASMIPRRATPEAKLALIRQYQAEGRLVAMTGDGTNDVQRWRRQMSRWR